VGAGAKRRQPADRQPEGWRSQQRRLWEIRQPMNKNLIRGRRGGTSWHNTAKSRHSAPQVNGAVGRRRFQFLSGEISPGGTGREVSRGHSSDRGAGGWKTPV
jgi:hypothetical protein